MEKSKFFVLNIIFIINFHYLESLEIMKGVIYIQLSIMLQVIQNVVRTSIDTSKKIFEQISILPKTLFEQYRYFKTCVRTSIDTSKLVFEQVSILQKVSSFTALIHCHVTMFFSL